jgi:hypothetical protein
MKNGGKTGKRRGAGKKIEVGGIEVKVKTPPPRKVRPCQDSFRSRLYKE